LTISLRPVPGVHVDEDGEIAWSRRRIQYAIVRHEGDWIPAPTWRNTGGPPQAHAICSKLNVMAVQLSDIRSLSDFQRNTRDHIQHLKQSGKPLILTVNGQAEVVVQSAEAYQKLLDDQELLESIRGIGRGLEQSKRGEGLPMREFLRSLAEEHGIDIK
jgi:PHD/YefM family antitoxin component YafN of YafNO toxin-antitoxin module